MASCTTDLSTHDGAIVAAVPMGVEIVGKLVSLTGVVGPAIDAVLLMGMVNGVRGAWALRRGIADPEAVAKTFR